PVDSDGNQIPGNHNVPYENDPTDPTKGGETPVPTIPGYHVEDSNNPSVHTTDGHTTVTPNDPGKDTDVIYVKDDAQATVMFIDETDSHSHNVLPKVSIHGLAGEDIDFAPAIAFIDTYKNSGYEVVSNNIPSEITKYDLILDNGTVSQVYTVHLKHGVVTIGGDTGNNPKAGDKINPNDPHSKTFTNDETNVNADHTFTVTYTGSNNNPANNVQTTHWTRTVTVDKVTGQKISATDWVTKDSYHEVDTPVVTGYIADKAKANVSDASNYTDKVQPEDYSVTVTYSKVGNFIPVDNTGKPIPGTNPQPYKNDPQDPTKVLPDEDVPSVPGYHTETPKLTPVDPTKDTKVVYIKDDTKVTDNNGDSTSDGQAGSDITKDDNNPGTISDDNQLISPESESEPDNHKLVKKQKHEKDVIVNKIPKTEPGKSHEANRQSSAKNGHLTRVAKQSLPQTGAHKSTMAIVFGILAAGLGLFGLAGKRKKED
ncbi:LPXTG cell wall anchor domain-containing protein, partial [Lactobacillus xujianguonis]